MLLLIFWYAVDVLLLVLAGMLVGVFFLHGLSHITTRRPGASARVDIALKALSPGVNDTATAVVCIDYLGAILAELAGRTRRNFESLVRGSFDQIRDVAADNTAIYLRLLKRPRNGHPANNDNQTQSGAR